MQKRMSGQGQSAAAAANGVNLRNNNFMRPSSANAKRKDGSVGGDPNDFNNANMRQLLA